MFLTARVGPQLVSNGSSRENKKTPQASGFLLTITSPRVGSDVAPLTLQLEASESIHCGLHGEKNPRQDAESLFTPCGVDSFPIWRPASDFIFRLSVYHHFSRIKSPHLFVLASSDRLTRRRELSATWNYSKVKIDQTRTPELIMCTFTHDVLSLTGNQRRGDSDGGGFPTYNLLFD